MKSILLLAYQISPTRGSEYGVGWNFAINLAKRNRVYLICGASGDHMGDTKEIEEYFQEHPNKNISVIAVKPLRFVTYINWFNKIGLTPVFYVAFMFWHRQVYAQIRELLKVEHIDVIHHLNPIGFREPGYLWQLGKPFVWGPIGGAQFVKPELLKNTSLRYKFLILLKNAITLIQLKYYPRVRQAAMHSSQLVFSTEESKNSFERYLGKTGPVISEQGTFGFSVNTSAHDENIEYPLRMIWVGRVEKIKNLEFLFNALALITLKKKWILNIIGDGHEVEKLKELSSNLGISQNIVWHGKRPRVEAISLIAESDLHVLTSLSEGNPAVLYEAISVGVPTISLDQNGMHTALANGNGVLIPITTYSQTLNKFAIEIESFITNPNLLVELRNQLAPQIASYSWEKKIANFESIYDDVIIRS